MERCGKGEVASYSIADKDFSETFDPGPSICYMIDFYDFSISHLSKGIKEVHGVDPGQIKTVNGILHFSGIGLDKYQ